MFTRYTQQILEDVTLKKRIKIRDSERIIFAQHCHSLVRGSCNDSFQEVNRLCHSLLNVWLLLFNHSNMDSMQNLKVKVSLRQMNDY